MMNGLSQNISRTPSNRRRSPPQISNESRIGLAAAGGRARVHIIGPHFWGVIPFADNAKWKITVSLPEWEN